jgi:hypothetical protein
MIASLFFPASLHSATLHSLQKPIHVSPLDEYLQSVFQYPWSSKTFAAVLTSLRASPSRDRTSDVERYSVHRRLCTS